MLLNEISDFKYDLSAIGYNIYIIHSILCCKKLSFEEQFQKNGVITA